MNATWSRMEALFSQALALGEPERTAFLNADCGGDDALRHEIMAMLAAHEQPLGIEPRLLAGEAFMPPSGVRVGPYRLLEPLGSGGMGSVWLAEHADGMLDRRVAVKLVRMAYAPDEAGALCRRFEAERRILARLEHPGIVRLLEAGTAAPGLGIPGGTPYFAMEAVAGEPLTTYAAQHALSVQARLQLFLQVCDAVTYAHQRLVVHRDLKPSNLLVTSEGVVKLLDFGIARLLEEEPGGSVHTETGLRPMTRAYAAPEQIRGEPPTTATDVYSLGVVLYELLTGRRPFDAPTPTQLETAILTAMPPRPSSVGGAGRPSGVIASNQLRGDLDAITLKALRKEPEARYSSAEALATDLRRYLDGRPVHARVPTMGYRMGVFVRRHRAGVGASVVAVALLVSFIVALAVQQRATVRERNAAEATASFLESLFEAADPLAGERQDTLRIAALLDRGAERARLELADQPLVRARLLHVIGRAYVRLGSHPKAEGLLSEAVALLRTEPDVVLLGQSLAELAAVRSARWNHAEAEALAREAVVIAERAGDPSLRSQAEYALGVVLLNAGRSAEARSVLEASVARQRRIQQDDLAAAEAEQMLARTLVDLGRLDEAEVLLQSLRTRIVRRHGPAAPQLMAVLSALTFLHLISENTDAAEAVGAEAVALSRAVRPGSSTLGEVLTVYGAVLRRQDRLPEAEAILREALTLPPMRPEARAIPLGTLASVLEQKGDAEGAVAAQRRALRLLESAEHPDEAAIGFSRQKLARLLSAAGREAEAEAVLRAIPPRAVWDSAHAEPREP